MTQATMVERSGPSIRAALLEHAPDDCVSFDADFRQAVSEAGVTFDLAPVDAVLDRWWGIAAIHANPLSEDEKSQVSRAKDGDFTGFHARQKDGNWTQL